MELTKRGNSVMFRNNVGQAWAGQVTKLPNGDVLIKNPYPINFGLCKGSSDLIGYTKVKVTPPMLDKYIAVFTALEVKRPGKQPSPEQRNFIAKVRGDGGRAGICTDPSSANLIVEGKL